MKNRFLLYFAVFSMLACYAVYADDSKDETVSQDATMAHQASETATNPAAIAISEQRTISVIRVRGNKAVSSATILSKLKSKPGDEFSQEQLNADLKRLFGLGFFTDISIDVEDSPGGVTVTFVVVEKPLVGKITFVGNKSIRMEKLKKELKTAENEMLDETKLNRDMEQIKTVYQKRGYQRVEASYKIDVDKDKNTAAITITIDEKTRVKIHRLNFSGNRNIASKKLAKAISTRADSLFTSGYFKEDTFQTDLEKIKGLYENAGFLDAKVDHKIEYDKAGRWMDITIIIEEGKKYLIGDIAINGNVVFPVREVRSKLKMVSTKPFSSMGLRQDTAEIQQFYYQKGYMKAQVDGTSAFDPQTGKVNITYTITENEVIYIDKINVKGNSKTKDIVIRRELRSYPGEKFDGDKLRRSKERLYNLGFFEEVVFDTAPGSAPNKEDLDVTVKETKTGEFAFGGGFSSVEQLIGFVSVTQKNFDLFNFPTFTGDGQRLKLTGEFGTIRENYELSWTEPWIFDMPLLFGFDLYKQIRSRREGLGYGFDEDRTGGDIRFGKEITEYLRADLMYTLENVKIGGVDSGASADLRAEEGKNRLSKLAFALTQDNRDNAYNPKTGYLAATNTEYASGFLGGSKDFVKETVSTSFYFPFFDVTVLELSGRVGAADALAGKRNIPIYERFYVGGTNSIRGYRERRIGPKDPDSGDPVGGEGLMLGNVEYTFPMYEKVLKGAIFYDIGNVVQRWNQLSFNGLKSGTGAGIRVKTPIGPIKLDYGIPLSNVEGEKKKGRFHFTLTQGF
ncbi:MAG: outer membrane protein assembly factor BamA [Candidatus Omnitrophica bacterium]|nr:outer membrane protein assembly factor BamA [Candidatus Omnitrophota bacterium]